MGKIYILILFFITQSTLFVSAQVLNDYRSNVLNGNWNVVGSWQRFDGAVWVAAAATPTAATANVITIRNGHTINATAAVTVDQVVVEVGATLNWTTGVLTVSNGAGVDLQVDGTLIDLSTSSVSFAASATWQLGATGTIARHRANSTVNWQNAYQGGIATIPATSNWILRKTLATNPNISTIGAFFGNLIIENNTASHWDASAVASTFQGAGGFPTIKGNLDIGGAGTNTVAFYNNQTNASPTLVLGNMTIRNGCTYNNNGTGTEVRGNLTVTGTLAYDATDNRQMVFSGGNAQSISGVGTANIFNLIINKSSQDLTLNKAITVANQLTLTAGKIFTTAANLLTMANGSTISGGSDLSFVSGPLRKIGNTAFTFPVGKGSNYQELTLGVNSASGGGTIWTEDFGTGTCANQNTRVINHINVATGMPWTETITTDGGAANIFFVSPTEAGMGVGVCGDGCLANGALTNQTLHIGNHPFSPIACFFCPTGDCGAAYDATPIGSGFGLCSPEASPVTDRRAESPIINCSGFSNISLSFNYMEGGQGVIDDAEVWYFDGSVWALLSNMGKTVASCGGPGLWTAFSVSLPASANNNPNVRIGFRWLNNEDNVGTDPSFAVDDIQLFEAVPIDIFTCEYFQADPKTSIGSPMEPTILALDAAEYWILDRNAGTAPRTVTLSWDGTSTGISNLAALQVCRWDGAIWRDHGNGGTTGATSPTPCNGPTTCGTVVSATGIASFSPFAIGVPEESLPIKLLDFSASPVGKKVQLQWSVAQEIDHDYYDVQHSTDAMEFQSIGTVNGVGNTNITQYYNHDHLRPVAGFNYYRLRIVSTTGQIEYSPIVVVEMKEGLPNFVLSPNPAKETISVSWNNQALTDNWSVEVIDVQGRLVQSFLLSGYTQTISVAELANGFYWFRFTSKSDVIVQKVIKN